MLLNSRELRRFSIVFAERLQGKVSDLLFDPLHWHVPYLAVKKGGLFRQKTMLIDTSSILVVEHPEERIIVKETSDTAGLVLKSGTDAAAQRYGLLTGDSLEEMTAKARDLRLGRTHGLIVETQTWRARYLIADTGESLTARIVIVPIALAKLAEEHSNTIAIDLVSEALRNCPEYDGDAEITREFEAYIHEFFQVAPYW